VTSPPHPVEIECPNCGTRFTAYLRSSINLTLGETWTEEEIENATTSTRPTCGTRLSYEALIIG
jgi:hypothetical protein